MNLKDRGKQLKRDIPALVLAIRKKETPWYAKLLVWITIVYALSPIDLIPDFIPILGYLDDIVILPLLITATIKLIPSDIFELCRIESESIRSDLNNKKWYYSIPIIAIWLFVAFLIIKALLSVF